MGERGQDLGVLRKEFLLLALQTIQERLTVHNEEKLVIEDQPGQRTQVYKN